MIHSYRCLLGSPRMKGGRTVITIVSWDLVKLSKKTIIALWGYSKRCLCPHRFVLPQNAIVPEQVLRYHRTKCRGGMRTGTVLFSSTRMIFHNRLKKNKIFSRATRPVFYETIVTSRDQISSGSRSAQHYRTVAEQPLQTPSG